MEWARDGTAPEATRTFFDYSTNGGADFLPLGSGTRNSGGWEITGVSIPADAMVRARAFTSGGLNNGPSGIVEDVLIIRKILFFRFPFLYSQ